MKKKKLTGKQIKLTINIISLAIFVFSYFYLYEYYVKKTEKAYSDVELVKAQIIDREQKLKEEDSVQDQIAEVKAQKQAIIDSFPVYIEDEDNFMFIEQMENAINIKTSSVTTSESSVFYDTTIPIQGSDNAEEVASGNTEADTPAATDNSTAVTDASPAATDSNNAETVTANTNTMVATVNTLGMSFITDYKGLKDIANYISNYPDHTIIESIAVSADNTTGLLAGNLVLKRYALTGTGKEYVEPSIDGIDIGMDNIFGDDAE